MGLKINYTGKRGSAYFFFAVFSEDIKLKLPYRGLHCDTENLSRLRKIYDSRGGSPSLIFDEASLSGLDPNESKDFKSKIEEALGVKSL